MTQLKQIDKLNKKGNRRGMTLASQANLKPTPQWKPGESGNKKGYSIISRLRDMMWEVCPDDEEGRIWGEVETEAVLRQALTKPEAMKTLLDRHEGVVNPASQGNDNRVFNIIVSDRAAEAIAKFKDRAKEITDGAQGRG